MERREFDFHIQLIFSEDGRVAGGELLVRGIKPHAYADSLLLSHSIWLAEYIHYKTGGLVLPHVNMYPTSLEVIEYLYNGTFPLVVEIVESGQHDIEQIVKYVKHYKSKYNLLYFAVDDFGVGNSNFHMLNGSGTVFDIVKIDTEFVPPRVIVDTIEHAKQKGLKVFLEKATPKALPGADGYQCFQLHTPEPWHVFIGAGRLSAFSIRNGVVDMHS